MIMQKGGKLSSSFSYHSQTQMSLQLILLRSDQLSNLHITLSAKLTDMNMT